MPNQKTAVEMIWSLYDQQGKYSLPEVEWMTGDKLNCGSNNGGFWVGAYYGDTTHTTCDAGVTWGGTNFMQVAIMEGEAFHITALAHEHLHVALWNEGIDEGDPTHSDPRWGINFGHPFNLLDQANQNLADEGL